jgi:triacylglycerol lipase
MNDYPIVLAHGIARFEFLLAHLVRSIESLGISMDRAADGLNYFKGIARHLRKEGFDVAHTNVSFAGGVETRAADLKEEINTILKSRGKSKVHIIGHSMGGLDSRHMIVGHDMADKIRSLTTLGTPHFGTSFADWGMSHNGDEIIEHLHGIIDITGFADLTTEACREFNKKAEAAEAANDVYYQTYASSEKRELVFTPLKASWDIIQETEGDNDGLASHSTQRWVGELVGANGQTKIVHQHDFPVSADHLNEIGWWDLNQLRTVNLFKTSIPSAIREYEGKIKDVYLDIARNLRQLPQ